VTLVPFCQLTPSFGPEIDDRDLVTAALALTPSDLHSTLPVLDD
jgi:hypothetical protein